MEFNHEALKEPFPMLFVIGSWEVKEVKETRSLHLLSSSSSSLSSWLSPSSSSTTHSSVCLPSTNTNLNTTTIRTLMLLSTLGSPWDEGH
ncbi:hypothetical protein HMI55_006667 [Coelomomyces lativittatus]|nr:hypothetical protein HMI56_002722 [Coelomomyces lativittatus]KAJ1511253.1 hypothetical protein HMI55_006667 [Coelomomyces lativittatus]